MSQNETILIDLSMAELFNSLIDEATKKVGFELQESSHAYILSFLERCLFTSSLADVGGKEEPMIAEVLLKALQEEKVSKKQRDLQSLGEAILFKSGFFAGSFKRKIIGIDYYIDMGSVAYRNLYESSKDPVHEDLSSRFSGYVGLFSEVGHRVNFSDQEGILTLFDRYLEGGSVSAGAKLIELGVFPAQMKKASNQ